jgi:intraflagellar transport protein 140
LGDVFAQLIEHTFYKQQNVQSAYSYLEKMKKKGIIVTPYLDSAMVEKIYRGMGM